MPGAGKTTVFSALSCKPVEPQFLGFDVKPHRAMVSIPDPRLEEVGQLAKSKRTVHNTIEFVDIPGFNPAVTDRKLVTAMLEHYRRCDALALVVNLFDPAEAAQAGSGMRHLLDELVLIDLVIAEGSAHRLAKAAHLKADRESEERHKLLKRISGELEEGTPVRRMTFDEHEQKLIREYAFYSGQPVVVVANVRDGDIPKPLNEIAGMGKVLATADEEQLETVMLSATLQVELCAMEEAEALEYMAEFGVSELAVPKLIRACFESLDLITFYTATEKECRAWSLKRGSTAQEAAGTVHTDMARGFIRAETVGGDDYVQYGGLAGAKAAGKMRLEGKEYVVADGEVLYIRFNI
jgi:GTP-binding protein YchF